MNLVMAVSAANGLGSEGMFSCSKTCARRLGTSGKGQYEAAMVPLQEPLSSDSRLYWSVWTSARNWPGPALPVVRRSRKQCTEPRGFMMSGTVCIGSELF